MTKCLYGLDNGGHLEDSETLMYRACSGGMYGVSFDAVTRREQGGGWAPPSCALTCVNGYVVMCFSLPVLPRAVSHGITASMITRLCHCGY